MPVIQSRINKIFDDNLFDEFQDHVDEMKEVEMGFESEMGIHGRSEDYFIETAIDVTSVIENYKDDYDLFEILDIDYVDGEFVLPDEPLEDIAFGFNYDMNVHMFKNELKKKSGYKFLKDNMLDLLYQGRSILMNTDFPEDFKNSDDYFFSCVDTIIRKHHDEIHTDVDFIQNKYSNYVLNLSRTSLYNDFKHNYELDNKENPYSRKPINLLEFLSNRAKTLLTLDKMEDLLKDNDLEDKNYNKELYNANHFVEIQKILENIKTEDRIRKIKKNTSEMLAKHFNKDSLSKNHFYKHIKAIADKKIETTFLIERKEENTIMFAEPFDDVISLFKNNTNLIKANQKLDKSDPYYFDIYKTKSSEELFDGFHALKERSELKKYIKRYIGSHKHLLDNESLQLFKIIKDNGIDTQLVKSELSGIVQFQDSKVLNSHLDRIVEKTNTFSKYQLISNINKNKLNADVFYENNKTIAVKLNDLEAAMKLAPSSWCISRSQSLFNNYKTDGHNIIIFDYTKQEKDSNSVIGVSIRADSSIKSSFNKFNTSIENKTEIIEIRDIIKASKWNDIEKDIQSYKNKEKSISVTRDPVSTMISCGFDDLDKEEIKGLIIESLVNNSKFNSWEKREWFNNVLTLNEKLKTNNKSINLLSISDIKKIAEEINHPLLFLKKKNGTNNSMKIKHKIT